MKYDLSIIIPFLNEKDNLERLTAELSKYAALLKINTEVVFVDDGSSDGSSDYLEKLTHSNYSAKIIKLSRNFGSHAALRAGIAHAESDVITFLSADLQDPPEILLGLYGKINEGYDIVWAQRRTTKVGFTEKSLSKLYARLMRRFAISNFPEYGCDLVMFNKKVKDELNGHAESNSSIFLQILNLGFNQTSVEYDRAARKTGKSKWTLSKKTKLLIDSFVAFSYFPIRFVSIVGIALFLIGSIWAVYIAARALLVGDLNPGWPSLIVILMIGFGITNISLGIIAEYLWRTLDEARGRKTFIVDEIIIIKQDRASGLAPSGPRAI